MRAPRNRDSAPKAAPAAAASGRGVAVSTATPGPLSRSGERSAAEPRRPSTGACSAADRIRRSYPPGRRPTIDARPSCPNTASWRAGGQRAGTDVISAGRSGLGRLAPATRLALVEPVPAEHHPHGPPENPQVERERRVLDVPEVELDPLAPRQRRAALDLCPARQARQHGEPAALALGVAVDLDLNRRARPDDRHLTPQHVHEVRKL